MTKFISFCFIFIFIFSVHVNASDKLGGIDSLDLLDHSRLRLEMVSDSWETAGNSRGTQCKYIKNNTSFKSLMKLVKLSNDDFTTVDTSTEDYSQESYYWDTCNYLYYPGKKDGAKVLEWFPADIVYENKVAALLVQKLDDGNVRALYVDKNRQERSVEEESKSHMVLDLWNFLKLLLFE